MTWNMPKRETLEYAHQLGNAECSPRYQSMLSTLEMFHNHPSSDTQKLQGVPYTIKKHAWLLTGTKNVWGARQ